MMVRFTRRARRDISEIYNWLVDRNPVAARQVEDFIRKASLGLAEFPMMGVPTDLAQVRRLPLVRYPYTIFYRVDDTGGFVDILRIVHGSRIRDAGSMPGESD